MSRKDSQKSNDNTAKQTVHKPQPVVAPTPEQVNSLEISQVSPTTEANNLARNHEPVRASQILRLQKTVGNRHVSNRLGHPFAGSTSAVSFPAVQREMEVSQPEDELEKEADQVAEATMRKGGTAAPPAGEDDPADDDLTIQAKAEQGSGDGDDELEIQAKMAVNEPGDEYEQEADAVAAEVMRMGEDEEEISRQPILQRQVQRQGAGTPAVTPEIEQGVNSLQSGGSPLPAGEREFFESRMGADFSDVKIHNNSQANHLSNDLEARAFTVGHSIAFNEGEYQPGSTGGRELLAHELTHVVQQGAAPQLKRKVIQRDGGEGGTTETAPEPSPEEKAAASAAAAQAEAIAAEAKSTGESKIVESQGSAQTEAAAGEGPKQVAAESIAAGPVSDEAEEARLIAAMANAQTTATAAEAKKQEAQTKAEATTQQAQSAPVPNAPAAPAFTKGGNGSGGGGVGNAATTTAKTSVDSAFVTAQNPADKAPRSTGEDPAYATVQEAATATAEQERTHGDPQGEADEAQAASVSPQAELDSQAQTAQVGQMEAAETPAFDAAGFKAALMDKITALTPATSEEADNFKDSGSLDGVKSELSGQVSDNQAASEEPLQSEVAGGPDTSAADPKDTTTLTPNDPGTQPTTIGADKAVPKVKGEGELETPLETSHTALDKQMADAEITEEQLSISNESTFTGALESKESAQTAVAEAPTTYRQFEDGLVTQAEAEAVSAAQTQLAAMHDERLTQLGEVATEQQATKTEDEQKRAQVAADITAIYTTSKSKVEGILAGIDGEVNQAFDTGAQEARTAFENYVEAKMEAYKQERYGGWLGWAQWIADKVMGMPGEVNAFYTEGRQLYLDKMSAVIDHVVSIVGTRLAEAKAEVANGKKQIQTYVDQLPDDLKEVGQQSAQDVQSKFDQLDQQINSKQNELIDSLAQKYVENLQALDARIEELKAQNKGLVDYAIEAIGGVIETILELKNLLLEVLSNAADAVMAILEDPITFISNLLAAVKQGLQNFVANIATHLQTGFIEWLTGTMGGAGITMPENIFSLEGVLDLTLQVLGLTWDNFRSRAVGVFGEPVVTALETVFEVFVILKDEGMPGLITWAQEQLASLQDQVIEGIKEMLITEVVEAGITWLISVLGGPAGAFIKAVQTIYNVVTWFLDNAQQLASLINAVSLAVVDIAAGNIGGAAQYVEDALAKFVPTAIGFLAGLLGLGDLSQKVRKIIDKIQEPVNNAIDSVLNIIKGFVMKIAKMLGVGGSGGAEAGDGDIGEPVSFSSEEEGHKLWFETQGEDAQLMIASTPTPLEALAARWRTKLYAEDSPVPVDDRPAVNSDLEILEVASGKVDIMGDALLKTVKGKNGTLNEKSGDTLKEQDDQVARDQKELVPYLIRLFDIFDSTMDKAVMEKGPKGFLDEDCHKSWNEARGYLRNGQLTEAGMSVLVAYRNEEMAHKPESPFLADVKAQTKVYAEEQYSFMKREFDERFEAAGISGVEFKITPRDITFESGGSTSLTSDIDFNLSGDATEKAVEIFNDKFRSTYGAESGTYFDVNVYAKNYVPDKGSSVDELKGVEGEVVYNDSAVNSYVALLIQMTRTEWETFKTNAVKGLEAEDAAKLEELFKQGEERYSWREKEIEDQYNLELKNTDQAVKEDEEHLTTAKSNVTEVVAANETALNNPVEPDQAEPGQTENQPSAGQGGHTHGNGRVTDVELRAQNELFSQKLKAVEDLRLELILLQEQVTQLEALMEKLTAKKDGEPDSTNDLTTIEQMLKTLKEEITAKKLALRPKINEAYLYANEVYLTKGAVTSVVVEGQLKKHYPEGAPQPNSVEENVDAVNDNVAGALHQLHTIESGLPLTAKPFKYVDRIALIPGYLGLDQDRLLNLMVEADTIQEMYNDGVTPDKDRVATLRANLSTLLVDVNRLRVPSGQP